MAGSTTTPHVRESHKKLKPNAARKEKQTAHAANLSAKTEP